MSCRLPSLSRVQIATVVGKVRKYIKEVSKKIQEMQGRSDITKDAQLTAHASVAFVLFQFTLPRSILDCVFLSRNCAGNIACASSRMSTTTSGSTIC